MRRRFILAAPVALSACGSLLPAQKYTPRVNWDLAPPPPAFPPHTGTGPVLLIRPVAAAPGLEARGLRSLNADGSLKLDYYNLWAVPPADAVTQALVNWAQASGMFSAVVTPGTRLDAGLILEGELTELIAVPGQNEARAALTLAVIKPAGGLTGTALPLTQVLLRASAKLRGTDAAAAAAAENDAVASLLGQAMDLLTRFA